MDNLGKIIVDTGSEKLPKVQKIAKSGHTGHGFDSWTREKLIKNSLGKAKFMALTAYNLMDPKDSN